MDLQNINKILIKAIKKQSVNDLHLVEKLCLVNDTEVFDLGFVYNTHYGVICDGKLIYAHNCNTGVFQNSYLNYLNEIMNCSKLGMIPSNSFTIPNFFFKFKNVTELDLSHNKISRIPNDIKNLTNLESIKLNNNSFTTFPKVLLEMNLNNIEIDNNKLTELPSFAKNCEGKISIKNNNIKYLPNTFLIK